jgi:hypothetical protein
MKKFMPRQSKKANELENTITSVADSSEDVAELGNILRDASYGMLSEKALKAITKLYDKVDFKETAIALDPTMKRQYLQRADGSY